MLQTLEEQRAHYAAVRARINGASSLKRERPVERLAIAFGEPPKQQAAPRKDNPRELALKAIEDEYRDICKGAQAIYDDRMKTVRRAMRAARDAFTRAEADIREAEQIHVIEMHANLAEARDWKKRARQAVLGRPKDLSRRGKKVEQ